MKTKIIILVLIAWNLSIHAQTMPSSIHSYTFSGNANDATGNKHGTIVGATLCPDRFGNPNSAYQFNGISNYIELNHSFGPYTEFSISAWFKCTATTSDPLQAIFSSDNSNKFVHMNFATSGTAGIASYVIPSAAITLNTTTTSLNNWHQWIVTCKSGETKFYVNGVLQGTSPQTFNATAITNLMSIGRGHLNGRYFNGSIDDIKIYQTALTNLQVGSIWAFENGQQTLKPGSGNCIYLDGINDYVHFGNAHVPTGNFTLEFWVKNLISNNGFREFVSQGVGGSAFYIGVTPTGIIRCGDTWQMSSVTLPNDKWTHVAVVKDGTIGQLYLNGILKATTTGYSISSGGPLRIGKQYDPYGEYPKCFLDEFRIWNGVLTQTDIQERMCRKITLSDPLSPNLITYYNFDEEQTSNPYVYDAVSNVDNGILSNGAYRTLSGAPIGNVSAFHYAGSNTNVSLTMPGRGDVFSASAYQSLFTQGIHIYAVDEAPNANTTAGSQNAYLTDKYFGTFIVEGIQPWCNLSYNYSGIPGAIGCNEGSLKLFARNNNSLLYWGNMGPFQILNTSNNTISYEGAGQNEFLIGSIGYPLTTNNNLTLDTTYQMGAFNCTVPYDWDINLTSYFTPGTFTYNNGCFTNYLTLFEDSIEVQSSNGNNTVCGGTLITITTTHAANGLNPNIGGYDWSITDGVNMFTSASPDHTFSQQFIPTTSTTYTITASQAGL